MTAAAATGPANGPRPASSTPAISCNPRALKSASSDRSGMGRRCSSHRRFWRFRRNPPGDNAAAEHRITLIEHRRLPGGDGSLRAMETYHRSSSDRSNCRRGFGKFVANFHSDTEFTGGRRAGYPGHRIGVETILVQLFFGADDDLASVRFQPDDETCRPTGEAETTALADGEILDSFVLAQHVTRRINDVAGVFVGALTQKLAVISGGYEANVLAVGLVGVGEIGIGGEPANVALGVVTDWHEGGGQLILPHSKQDV